MFDLADHLPLQLIKSEAIPPAPNRSESAIDWLPDFSGYSWIAYGASSLLVISHFPSPLSEDEPLIGPIFRQVFELSSDGSGSVSAVSWSTVTPSLGDLAAALDNCIGLYSYNSEISNGSFCWSQTAVLVQSTKVETIKWTGSGDGLISGGIEVVLWRKNDRSWEIAWKFKPQLPQTLVATTFSIEGPSATAPLSIPHVEGSSPPISKASKSVFVIYSDGRSKYEKAELCHPLPVSMVQWRPSTSKQSIKHAINQLRMVLLTCCNDGTVRLWSDIDDGRVRKSGKEFNDQRATRVSFRVSAVIEINQAMNGTIGSDIFVRWAIDFDDIFNIGKDASQYVCSEDNEQERSGRCEWLIGFGPQMLVSLWAIHCLDDVAPMRFPRVTLWKKQELTGPYSEASSFLELTGPYSEASSFLLHKVVISRDQIFGPPSVCSLIRLLPCNSLAWLQLNSQTSTSIEEGSLNKSHSENQLSCCANEMLNIDGHAGKILQVAVHSYGCEVEIAASLDANGSLLFWLLSTVSNCIMGLPTLNPAWKLYGKHDFQGSHPKYSTLNWAPTILDEERVLFMGHAEGIDCFIVNVSTDEEKIVCDYLGTIPFISWGCREEPTSIYSVSLPYTSNETVVSNTFMLIVVSANKSLALSWKITIHPYDLTLEKNGVLTFKSNFAGKRNCISVDACSSICPDPSNHVRSRCFAVLCPINFVSREEEKFSKSSAYHMVTGCSDGSLKLWKCNSNSQWEVVGMLAAHEGPILKVSPTDCGRKIATVSPAVDLTTCSTLRIWGSVLLTGAGSFILEDTLSFNGEVVCLNWLTMGNGQLLLGVCLQNEFRVYAQRRCGAQNLVKSEKHVEGNIWVCVAFNHTNPTIRDFFWGPKATAVIVHDEYFCLFSQCLFPLHENLNVKCPTIFEDGLSRCNGGLDEHSFTSNSADSDIRDFKESLMENNGKPCWSGPPVKMNLKNDILSSMSGERFKLKCNLVTKNGFWSVVEVAENLGGSLPIYHPEALLMNICSGNWKRAHIALRHLIDYLTSESKSATLKRYGNVIPPVQLSNYLEGNIISSSSDKTFQWTGDPSSTSSSQLDKGPLNQFASSWGSHTSNNSSSSFSVQSELSGFVEPLEKFHEHAAITSTEKMQMLAIVDLLLEVSNPHSAFAYGSLDEPGRRFWVAVRFQHLYFFRKTGRLPSPEELFVDLGLVGWAFHSDCQENLFNSLLSNEPSWQEMRNMGCGFWYTNATQLRVKMEKLARQQYLKRKDPKDCALLYIALNRLQVLAGLFKISKDEKDKPLVAFLSRNFQEDKNKAAALKNAYVLMGRHQLELACAFFLLGGDSSSAITVCAKNLGDEQLALVICHLLEGYGGPLERHLVSKILLPYAVEKRDYWFASFLEWILGNYTQAFMIMLGVKMDTLNSAVLSNHASFLDPSIGQYFIILATKNSMKNAIGERNAAVLGRWAISMSATALRRCGLPLEALECYSSSLSIFAGLDQGSTSDTANPEPLNEILKPCPSTSSNWISADVAFLLEFHTKLSLAMQYINKLLREHPSWPYANMVSPLLHADTDIQHYKALLENFQQKLSSGLAYFDQKFSLIPLQLINMILIYLYNNGLVFIGYHVLLCCTSQDPPQEKGSALDGPLLYSNIPQLILKATEETSYLFSRYVAASSITCSHFKSDSTERNVTCENGFGWSSAWGFYMQGLIQLLWSLRAALMLLSGSCTEDLIKIPVTILDLCEYYAYFASAWLQQNFKGLVLIAKPLLTTYTNGQTPYEISKDDLNKLLRQMAELLTRKSSLDEVGDASQITQPIIHENGRDTVHLIPEDERWKIIGASLWGHVSNFLIRHLNSLPVKLEENYPFRPPCRLSAFVSDSTRSELDSNNTETKIQLVSVVLSKLLKITFSHVSSYFEKQLALFLLQKIRDRSSSPTLLWLEEFIPVQPEAHHNIRGLESPNTMCSETELSAAEIWDMCAEPRILRGAFAQEYSKWTKYINLKDNKRWSHVCVRVVGECETEETCNHEGGLGSRSASSIVGSPVGDVSPDNHSFLSSGGKDTASKKKVMPFHNPKEIYKRNGELLEALCINSIDQQQAVLASNRKGIIFFNWDDGLPLITTSDYIWANADWPHDGWAGSESTPVPTCVSPGVGLGSKKGTHLGLGGATLGVDSSVRPVRDFTGGRAVGISGYTNAGPSHLGWEIQEDFEEFVDPPATAENVRTRAFSSHPSKPFFLVGSSNTHIYLWEFGKERATATYGVLPAANVPPPYALASISSVHFDHCGQRFATAALDGTVCTWQLEVGGRSNIRPTESSLCFNNRASDVTYVTGSGSIVAAAGYSSDGVNVVIWDTLAPSTTSRASIMCHEGGARSICVFDDGRGSGSISPLIVTGGKGGDVGLHDFRYIATGRSKRHHKHSDSGEHSASLTTDMRNKNGDQNRNGMLWYIPKAHLGSVTSVSAIPNTSYFLTGSRDGDVKLWDANKAKLVFHWPKLHDRHSFMQPGYRSFGGVVRDAITDIQVVSNGFLTCGGDGSVKMVQLKDFPHGL